MWYLNKVKKIDNKTKIKAIDRQNILTKPQGSLGVLESLAIKLAAHQGTLEPDISNIQITIFAGDHGIAEDKVSAFPQIVTAQMIENFTNGGATINILAKQYDAKFNIVDTGVAHPYGKLKQVLNASIALGTKNFRKEQAMTVEQLQQSLNIGKNIVKQAYKENIVLFIGGEMGIANTSSATAILCSLTNKSAFKLTGKGTGLNNKARENKALLIDKALKHHQVSEPLEVLQTYGGFEIAALVGAYISCAQHGITILVDGFITTVAALLAIKINPDVKQWMIFSHLSEEKAHKTVLQILDVNPLLNLKMRLGEGSGAALVLGILKSACLIHNNMATFKEAGVSE